ncbi:MAG: TerC family protein [Rhodobiaceae bacterium]|nr:TerC family protein [Rhodobiaceae bacterium]MCC0047916.1 TerC family protein [Rhodobiaceae bacterium]
MLELLTDPAIWAAFVTLTAMEIILGIDNIVFLSLLTGPLDKQTGRRARRIGLFLALLMRVALLFAITWIIGLTHPAFTLFDYTVTWRDLILLAGGLFLIVKATLEIHTGIEGTEQEKTGPKVKAGAAFAMIIAQIVVIDAVFSVDSILTAVGMADDVEVMIAAVMVAIAVMYVASEPIAGFIERHPTTKMLALAFLMLIGVALVADGLGFHIPRGYIYFAMAFSAVVEMINLAARQRRNSA